MPKVKVKKNPPKFLELAIKIMYYYVFHGRVTLFFANNSLMQCRITMKFLHNFFLDHEVFLVHIPCLLMLKQRSLLLYI